MSKEFKLWIDYPAEFKKVFHRPPSDFHQQCNNALQRIAGNPIKLLEEHLYHEGKSKEPLHVFTGELNGPDGTLKDKTATLKVKPEGLALKIQKLCEIYELTPLDILANAYSFYQRGTHNCDWTPFSHRPLSKLFTSKEELYDPKVIDTKLDEYRALCERLDNPPVEPPALIRPQRVEASSTADMNNLIADREAARDPTALAAARITRERDADKTWEQVVNITKGGKGARPRDMD